MATSTETSTSSTTGSMTGTFPFTKYFTDKVGTSDAGICYISKNESVVIKQPTGVVQTTVVVTPVGKKAISEKNEFLYRLADVGIDCGFAGLSVAAAAAACSAAVPTAGVTAVPCLLTGAGALTGSLQCGNSLGKLVNHAIDPKLNSYLENDSFYKTYEETVDFVDKVAAIGQGAHQLKHFGKLLKLRQAYGKDLTKRFSKNESKQIYREMAEAMDEFLSNQQTRVWINNKGFSHRFTSGVINATIQSKIVGGVKDATQPWVNSASKTGARTLIDAASEQSEPAPPVKFHTFQSMKP